MIPAEETLEVHMVFDNREDRILSAVHVNGSMTQGYINQVSPSEATLRKPSGAYISLPGGVEFFEQRLRSGRVQSFLTTYQLFWISWAN